MREDFKFPYRVITRQEEIEGSQALGFIIGLILFTFFLLIIMPPPYQIPTANQIPLCLFKYQENQC